MGDQQLSLIAEPAKPTTCLLCKGTGKLIGSECWICKGEGERIQYDPATAPWPEGF